MVKIVIVVALFHCLLVSGFPQGDKTENLEGPPPAVESLNEGEQPVEGISPKQASNLDAPYPGPDSVAPLAAPNAPNANQEEADDDSGLKVFNLDRKGTVNTFFPINFNAPPPNSRNVRQVERSEVATASSGSLDTPIAIANSFSTGSKGVANSDAVAGAPPAPATAPAAKLLDAPSADAVPEN